MRPAGTALRSAGLALICLLVFLPGIFSLPVTDRDEARFVQASRQMLESGDYLDIRFQDVPRYKKPVGIYWLQSAAAMITGQEKDPPVWAFRLVSFAGAVIAAFATMLIAASMFGPAAGFVAGAAMASALGLAFEARIAKTDAFLLAMVVLAQGALAEIYLAFAGRRKPAGYAPWLFWAAQGVGILIKGPVAPLISLLTIAGLAILDRRRGWLRGLNARCGVVLAAVIVLPWLIAITWKSGGGFWREAVGRDLMSKVAEGQESHGFPPGYYSITYSLFLWPIGYLGLLAGLNALNRLRLDARMRFLIAWYIPYWLVLEFVPTKLPHYMLPAYPAAAIAIGWLLTDRDARAIALSRWQTWLARLGLFGLALVSLALAVLPVAVTFYFGHRLSAATAFAALAFLAAGLLGSPFAERVSAIIRVPALALAAGAGYGLVTGAILPPIDQIWVSREVAQAYGAVKPCTDSRLVVTGYGEPSLVFLAGTSTDFTDAEGAASILAGDPQCAIAAVAARRKPDFDKAAAALGVAPRVLRTVTGLDYSNGREVELTLYAGR